MALERTFSILKPDATARNLNHRLPIERKAEA